MLGKKIKYIDIVFENCEEVRLYPEMIRLLEIEGITKSYWINCFQYENGETYTFIRCNSFSIGINSKGLEVNTEEPFSTNLRERLTKHHDITHIDIVFEDGTSEYISVPWGKEEQYTNTKQRTDIEDDYIFITIEEDGEN